MGREFKGRMNMCTRVAESLCCSPETITTLLISYIPIQNLKKQKNRTKKNKKTKTLPIVLKGVGTTALS